MGGGSSGLRKSTAPLVQRHQLETQHTYKIRSKFQNEKIVKTQAYKDVSVTFGNEPHSVESMIKIFNEKLNANVTSDIIKSFYGSVDSEYTVKKITQLYLDLLYSPSVGAIYHALMKDREVLNEAVWDEFLSDFQGHKPFMLGDVREGIIQSNPENVLPKTSSGFAKYLLGKYNGAFHPDLEQLQRLDRPICEYFVCVAKLPSLEKCETPDDAIQRLADTIHLGARALELEVCADVAGEPRVLGDLYPKETSTSDLPYFKTALEKFKQAIESCYSPERNMNTKCVSLGTEVGQLPLVLFLTFKSCSAQCQIKVGEYLKSVLGDMVNLPSMNVDGSGYSPAQLCGKVLLIAPSRTEPSDSEPRPVALEESLQSLISMRMVTVHEIRPILDRAKSRTELRKLLQNIVLSMTGTELCAHIMELSSITDILLIHVKTIKRKIWRPKQGNLMIKANENEERAIGDQDTRHIVQYSELKPGEQNYEARFENEVVMEEKQEEVEPLRGWRYGAQLIPVDQYLYKEASLQNSSLFRQQHNNGFVPRLPRTMFDGLEKFQDLYDDFPHEYARSLYMTILSAQRFPRGLDCTQPFLRIYSNNGTGLKQVAITSTVDDNGCTCVWEEDFEFKFHINDLNAAACLLFVLNDRDKPTNAPIVYTSVPLWALQTGYRSLPWYTMEGKLIEEASLFVHFDWEPED